MKKKHLAKYLVEKTVVVSTGLFARVVLLEIFMRSTFDLIRMRIKEYVGLEGKGLNS